MKKLIFPFLLLIAISCDEEAESQLIAMRMDSKYVASRNVQIFLPPSYDLTKNRYPVLYMHDGQMLFDSTTTWNGKELGIDETLKELWQEGSVPELIVVGIDNGGTALRHPEFFPQKPFESIEQTVQDSIYDLYRNEEYPLFANPIQSDNYLKFLVEELKPFIDSTYRTVRSKDQTLIAGSSMGALISMYAICEYPKVFGKAACLSTHWPGIFTDDNNPIPPAFFEYLRENLPSPTDHKLYFDLGTETLDAMYVELQPVADSIILAAGYDASNFKTLLFEGDAHDEMAWKNRFHIPLTFLLSE